MSFTSLSRSLPRTRRISVGKFNCCGLGALEEDGLKRILLIFQLRNQFVLLDSLKFVRVCVRAVRGRMDVYLVPRFSLV